MGADGSLTFEDLIIRVAEPGLVSSASSGPGIPTSAHDLALCKRWVNDGRQRFYRSMMGVFASWAKRPVQFTVDPSSPKGYSIDGQAHRVRLPWWCVGPLGSAAWWWDDGQGSRGEAAFVHLSTVDLELARIGSTGTPRCVAILPLMPSADEPVSARQGWELRLAPIPDRPITIRGQVLAGYQPMVDLDERDPAGADHDMAIVAWAHAARFATDPSDQKKKSYLEAALRATAESIQLERAKQPARSGEQVRDPETDALDVSERNRPYVANTVVFQE